MDGGGGGDLAEGAGELIIGELISVQPQIQQAEQQTGGPGVSLTPGFSFLVDTELANGLAPRPLLRQLSNAALSLLVALTGLVYAPINLS